MGTTTDINHADRAHSEIGASSANRWLNCPTSVVLSRGIEDKTSSYAAEGTCAHEVSEYCFENDVDAEACIGMEFEGHTVTEEMAAYVQFYLDKMEVYTNSEEYDVAIEEKFHLTKIHPDMFGSNDFCAMGRDNGELIIADFKYGKGINVSAKENIQLIIYALGAYYESDFIYKFKTVKLVVVQPRILGEEWDEWNISIDELLAYEAILKEGVEKVYSDNPGGKAGDHCRFCKAKPTCKIIHEKTQDVINYKFDEAPIEATPSLPAVEGMTVDQMVKVMTFSPLIEGWFKEVKLHVHGLIEKGEKVPGFKLVKKKSNRKIKDEKELIGAFKETFGDKLFRSQDPQLITLGNLEKLVGEKLLAPHLIKPDAGNAVAPITDKRPEVQPISEIVDDAFDEADESNDFDTMDF